MGVLIIMAGIAAFLFILTKAISGGSNNQNDNNPPSTRQYQAQLKRQAASAPEVRCVSRDAFLRRKGWANTPRKYFIAFRPFTLDVLEGYTETSIVGMQYREDISINDIGWFNGFAFCEVNNPHDRYAIAICRDDDKILGYIPKGDIDLWKYIASQGGVVHAYGALSYNPEEDKWYGSVAVEYEWEDGEDERNSLFLKPELTFYEPTIDLEKFLNTKQEEFKKETEE